MKRQIRLISLCLALIILCVSFTGCTRMLETIKSAQASILDNGNIKTPYHEYALLPAGDYDINATEYGSGLFFAEEGTPLLVASIFSDMSFEFSATLLNEDKFIEVENYGEDYECSYYCRLDLYDDISAKIEEGIEYTVYGYEVWGDDGYESTYLTEEQSAMIEDVLSTVKPKTMLAGSYMDYDYATSIYAHSEDLLFYKYAFDLCSLGEKYYFEVYGEDETLIYYVPEKYVSTFEEIITDSYGDEDMYFYY